MTYTIKEASDITGIPATTLRYYDKEGILPFLERKESGHRMFSEQDLSMLRIIECLKCTGMSIKDIRQYAVWAQMGDSTLEQRYNLFLERREAVMAQIKELEDQLKKAVLYILSQRLQPDEISDSYRKPPYAYCQSLQCF